jgi:diguanylate cyclase (GGDEF)-like protein
VNPKLVPLTDKERAMDKGKVRILVADDEEAIRGTLSALLGEEGYEVTAISSAEEAIARLGDDTFSLVLTDIRMGGMTGIELLQEVKRLHPATEVIIMTSYASLETAVLALRSGAYDYLLKPFEDLELVTTAVARAVEKGSLVRERDALVEALARKNRELSEVNAFLAERANRDGLTGLYNHRYFQEALARETALCERHGRDLSLIFGDVDNFKKFNDTHGHQAGDAVLRGIAEILRKCIRMSDILARYGGEEFVVLLPDTNKEDTRILAERIRAATESHPFPGRETQPGGKLTISLGISSFPEDGRQPADLIKGADSALYEAKRSGRNVIRTHG